jgi:hypothetical protein
MELKGCGVLGRLVKPGDDTYRCASALPYFFFTTFGLGSGFSACGSKPI